MRRSNRTNYFDMFSNLQQYSTKAAHYLDSILNNYDPTPHALLHQIEEMHVIEHTADLGKHDLMGKLAKEFITPIEREDIIQVTQMLDDITDAIEDVLQKLYMYNVKHIRPEALEFVAVILEQCAIMAKVFEEFHHFARSSEIHQYIIEVNGLEERADAIYTRSVRRLFEEEATHSERIAWTAIFDQLELCCDANENTANMIEEVIMKNM